MLFGLTFVFLSLSFFNEENCFSSDLLPVLSIDSIEVTWQIERATISNKKLIYNASCQSSRNEGANLFLHCIHYQLFS